MELIAIHRISDVLIPILAQRLMINMRKVDYVGTRPYASTLLFAHSPPGGSEYVPNKMDDSLELYSTSSGIRPKGSPVATSEKSDARTFV
jgi:hypothetical protein